MKKELKLICFIGLFLALFFIFPDRIYADWCCDRYMCWECGEGDTPYCFLAGTQVMIVEDANSESRIMNHEFGNLEEMEKAGIELLEEAIEEIEVGEWTLGFNEASQQFVINQVTEKFVHEEEEREIRKLTLANGQVLQGTPEHLIRVKGEGWFPLGKVKEGDYLWNKESSWIQVASVAKEEITSPVYNLETEPTHNYFANGFLVHNQKAGQDPCPPECPAGTYGACPRETFWDRNNDGDYNFTDLNGNGVCDSDETCDIVARHGVNGGDSGTANCNADLNDQARVVDTNEEDPIEGVPVIASATLSCCTGLTDLTDLPFLILPASYNADCGWIMDDGAVPAPTCSGKWRPMTVGYRSRNTNPVLPGTLFLAEAFNASLFADWGHSVVRFPSPENVDVWKADYQAGGGHGSYYQTSIPNGVMPDGPDYVCTKYHDDPIRIRCDNTANPPQVHDSIWNESVWGAAEGVVRMQVKVEKAGYSIGISEEGGALGVNYDDPNRTNDPGSRCLGGYDWPAGQAPPQNVRGSNWYANCIAQSTEITKNDLRDRNNEKVAVSITFLKSGWYTFSWVSRPASSDLLGQPSIFRVGNLTGGTIRFPVDQRYDQAKTTFRLYIFQDTDNDGVWDTDGTEPLRDDIVSSNNIGWASATGTTADSVVAYGSFDGNCIDLDHGCSGTTISHPGDGYYILEGAPAIYNYRFAIRRDNLLTDYYDSVYWRQDDDPVQDIRFDGDWYGTDIGNNQFPINGAESGATNIYFPISVFKDIEGWVHDVTGLEPNTDSGWRCSPSGDGTIMIGGSRRTASYSPMGEGRIRVSGLGGSLDLDPAGHFKTASKVSSEDSHTLSWQNYPAGYQELDVCYPGAPGRRNAIYIPDDDDFDVPSGDGVIQVHLAVARPMEPWFQTQDGDVHAGGSINDPIPITATEPYFSLRGDGGDPGVVSYIGGYNFGEGSVSEEGWLANTSLPRKLYGEYKTFLGSPSVENFSDLGSITADGVYYANRSLTLDEEFPSGKQAVVLIDGNLIIDTNIIVPVATESSLVMIVSGKITIRNGVSQVQGIFISDGEIDFGSGEVAFEGQGTFIAGSVRLGRDFDDFRNDTLPVEKFIFRPDLIINSLPDLWATSHTWQELAP